MERRGQHDLAEDLMLGATREALWRIGNESTLASYGTEMAELILEALGAEARLIASAMEHELPSLQ